MRPRAGGRRSRGGQGGAGVRISAGRWKGRRIPVPPGARPTSSRAREALFDLLGPRVVGARVLDLYAGSGAVGLEALSRGASLSILVEKDARALGQTLERLDAAAAGARLLPLDAASAVRDLVCDGQTFDLVFCDPPYGADALPEDLPRVLAPGGEIVVQRDAGESCPVVPGVSTVRTRAYGRNVFHFLAAEAAVL